MTVQNFVAFRRLCHIFSNYFNVYCGKLWCAITSTVSRQLSISQHVQSCGILRKINGWQYFYMQAGAESDLNAGKFDVTLRCGTCRRRRILNHHHHHHRNRKLPGAYCYRSGNKLLYTVVLPLRFDCDLLLSALNNAYPTYHVCPCRSCVYWLILLARVGRSAFVDVVISEITQAMWRHKLTFKLVLASSQYPMFTNAATYSLLTYLLSYLLNFSAVTEMLREIPRLKLLRAKFTFAYKKVRFLQV